LEFTSGVCRIEQVAAAIPAWRRRFHRSSVIESDLVFAVRADERHEHRRVLLIARDDPRFFAWDFSVLAARRTRHSSDVIDGARFDAGFVSHQDSIAYVVSKSGRVRPLLENFDAAGSVSHLINKS
jgi:hypothetical protein